jgi:maltooligosyltrehalose trehalohydrolase
LIKRWKDESEVFCIFNYNNNDAKIIIPLINGIWKKILDSSDEIWKGPGTYLPEMITQDEEITVRSQSLALYMKEET